MHRTLDKAHNPGLLVELGRVGLLSGFKAVTILGVFKERIETEIVNNLDTLLAQKHPVKATVKAAAKAATKKAAPRKRA